MFKTISNFFVKYFSVFRKAKPYSLYVLLVLYITYMLNQLDRYALSITNIETARDLKYGDKACFAGLNATTEEGKMCSNLNQTACESIYINNTGQHQCNYTYNGQGIEYQVVAGPIFIVIFTFTGIFLSIISDQLKNRKVIILSICLLFWSIMTLVTGFVTEFWQLALLRIGLGIGQAGCNPLATSLIADYFSVELRGSAISVYNWGIYTGYSLSFAIGNQILKHLGDEKLAGWRWVFIICGIPGIFFSIVIFFTIKEPKQMSLVKPDDEEENKPVVTEEPYLVRLGKVVIVFLKPSVLLLCFAGSIRNAAGYVWGYNNNSYYKLLGQSPDEISGYLGTIPLVAGIFGSFFGGFISDIVATKFAPYQRVWVLVISQIVAAPFAALVLIVDPPWSYWCLVPTYIFGEMWVGVCLSVLVELVPEKLRTTGVGFYFFIISNIGGNMQVIVPPIQTAIKSAFNLTEIQAFRGVLLLFYPGEYVLGSALFLLTLFALKTDLRTLQTESGSDSITNPLVKDNEIVDRDNEAKTSVSDYDNKAYSSSDEVDAKRKIN